MRPVALTMRFDVIGVTHFTTARTLRIIQYPIGIMQLVFENPPQGYESMLISFSLFTCVLLRQFPAGRHCVADEDFKVQEIRLDRAGDEGSAEKNWVFSILSLTDMMLDEKARCT